MSEKPSMTRKYHIPLDMFMEAFKAFQKKYVYPQNTALSACLLAIAGVYAHAVIKDNTKTFFYLIIVFCIAFVMSVWYRTLKMRRSLRDALKEIENDTYEMKLYSDKLTIRTEDAPPPAEDTAEPEEAPEESVQEQSGEGFQQIFPEKPAEPVQSIPPTEIFFEDRVKFHEFADFFMIYLVKRNFYLLPKKDFSEDEITQLRKAFRL